MVLGVSVFRGFYELFCGTILSNQGVLSGANQGFGHVSVYLLGPCPRADGLIWLISGGLGLNCSLPVILTMLL